MNLATDTSQRAMTDTYPIPEFLRRPVEAPRERPIIFSASMIRALLDGTKTQTRRPLKMQPLDVIPCDGEKAGIEWIGRMEADPPRGVIFACKFGRPGDRLYVREQFSYAHGQGPGDRGPVWFWADGAPRDGDWTRPKPSIHMPRWASRILLEIVEVRVERLNDISEADAVAEGIETVQVSETDFRYVNYLRADRCQYPKEATWGTAVRSYASLWDSINGPGSWESNPYVWVLAFRRISP